MIDHRVLVQARMSSKRFPGKVLAPLAGRPLIAHTLSRICEVLPRDRIVLVTSEDETDDPLATYVANELGIVVFRGSLNNVVERFQECLRAHPCKWFVRICGDSPAIDPCLLSWMLERTSDVLDLLTNVAERTFPPGESIEIVRASTFIGWKSKDLTSEEREHLTLHFYQHSDRYKIRNVYAAEPTFSCRRLVVDTLDDLRSIEQIFATEPRITRGYVTYARLGAEPI
jgi:spore coat polysaccharide biosynthesis protein SpsF